MGSNGKHDEARREKVKELLQYRRIAHDANQLLLDVMERWGGTSRFADALYREFMDARPGSIIRQNILEMIQKLVVNNTNHQITRVEDPSVFDDDEIERRLDATVVRVQGYVDDRAEGSTAARPPIYEESDPLV